MSDASDSPLPERPASDLRASDAEREQAVDALRRAVTDGRLGVDELEGRIQSAYTVRTRHELELLIADVSVQPLAGARAMAPTATGDKLTVREGPGGDRRIVSVMGGHERAGRWRVAKRCTVINVMGGSDLDLCDAELADREVELNVYSVMGGAEIHVPHGVDVHVSNFALMGGNEIKLGDELAAPDAPVIRIRLVSIMGGTSVRRGRKLTREERREQQELRRAERREQQELRRAERRRELDR